NVEDYIEEADCILIGPGMVRSEGFKVQSTKYNVQSLDQIDSIKDEGEETAELTNYLLRKYPQKQWVVDAGALQMMDIGCVPSHSILTPHHGEFKVLLEKCQINDRNEEESLQMLAEQRDCIVLLKGPIDIVCSPSDCRTIEGGNPGMTKGGTGDVLAGLIAALACKNDPFLATIAGSFINKKAGDELYKTVGPFFNASDLAHEIPKTMKFFLQASSHDRR
ncbi:MAG: ADP/ATP-dependent (S)-NAD(P)H-hydrate dehydratase, partial [bacterium]|nr:ADP/ATP-dependent (S)-NAD(P)H-hydrate dehydratase [bacterium]